MDFKIETRPYRWATEEEMMAIDPTWAAHEQRIRDLEEKRRIAFEKDREKARQEEAKRQETERATWAKIREDQDRRLAEIKAQRLKVAAEQQAQREEYLRKSWEAAQAAERAKLEQQTQEKERLKEAARQKAESQAKAREEKRKALEEEQKRLRVRCHAWGRKSFTKNFNTQQAKFKRRSQAHAARYRWLAQIAAANQWRSACKAQYDALSPQAQATVDYLDAERRRNAKDVRDRVAKESDHRDSGGLYGPRHCAAGSGSWDNAIRALEEDR